LVSGLEGSGLLREITGYARNRRFEFEPYLRLVDEQKEDGYGGEVARAAGGSGAAECGDRGQPEGAWVWGVSGSLRISLMRSTFKRGLASSPKTSRITASRSFAFLG